MEGKITPCLPSISRKSPWKCTNGKGPIGRQAEIEVIPDASRRCGAAQWDSVNPRTRYRGKGVLVASTLERAYAIDRGRGYGVRP